MTKLLKIFASVIPLLVLSPLYAANFENSIVKEKVQCSTTGQSFELIFANKKSEAAWDGDGFEDLWLIKKAPKLIGPSFDVRPIEALEQKSPCGKWLASEISCRVIAFPLFESSRPFPHQVSVAFIKDNSLLRISRKLGHLFEQTTPHPKPEIVAIDGGIRFLTWTPRTDGSGGEAIIRGQKVSVSEEDLFYWKRVTIRGNKIVEEVDRDETWESTNFRPYFKKKEDFEKAFVLLRNRKSFANNSMVMVATLPGPKKVKCIQPTANREIKKNGPWFCDDHK